MTRNSNEEIIEFNVTDKLKKWFRVKLQGSKTGSGKFTAVFCKMEIE